MSEATPTGGVADLPLTAKERSPAPALSSRQQTMQIVCISRGSLSRGKELAEALASRLGYQVLSREDLIEAAIAEGIHVGKLETSMMKPRAFTERLARERDHYLAFSTAYLCDQLQKGPLVYHGRTGHLLLRSVGHVLRVRVVADEEYRIRATMQQLGIDRDKAVRYLTEVEEDRRAWVRSMYGVSWEDASQYDVVVNVERMNVDNAASALVGMAQLPDFQVTPASQRAMDDLLLSATARLRLARDPRTNRFAFSVTAHEGIVNVTYLPHDMEVSEEVPRVLEGLPGMEQLQATMAATTILWVQEAFDATSETFRELTEIARKWNAAVELVRYVPSAEVGQGPETGTLPSPARTAAIAGIEEDVDEEVVDDGGLKATLDGLAGLGRSGGGRFVRGERSSLVGACCTTVPHSLVVLGNLFLGKEPGTKLRLTRELQDSLGSRMRVPVVTAEELRSHYLFGPRDAFRLLGFLAVVAVVYAVVLTHEDAVLRFLAGDWAGPGRLTMYVVAAAVFVFAPVVAYLYGTVARSLMKLLKME
ncbi:MAG: cytidylate kinase-like family protein [Gemmatimonadetes bacterium]|nr:cytidylate kinase-like family protein [Gemmatimonadota bacterium]